MTIPRALFAAAREVPREPALVDPDGSVTTFAEYLAAARRRAAGLAALGVVPGDRVAIWAPNSTDWALANAAILLAGAAVVPVNTRYTLHEATDIIGRAGCAVVIASRGFLGRDYLAELRSTGDHLSLVDVTADAEASDDDLTAIDDRADAVGAGDVCHVQFTSGTTGRPKGALLRHGASVSTSLQWIEHTGLRRGDRYPVVAPCSHLGGHKTGLLNALLARAVAMPEPVVDLPALTARIRDEGVTFVQAAPAVLQPLLDAARQDPATLRSLRVAVTGASVVPPSLVRDLRELVGCQVFTSYGLTETTGVVTITRPDDSIEAVATTCGRPLAGIEVEVVDTAGERVPAGERGEVRVRAASVMAGYLDDPDATATTIRDGWLYTGDVGAFDEAGRLQIVDRLKDMIVVGGLNVAPAEVEHALAAHPSCRAAAVVGVPDERLGEVPVAFVAPSGDTLDIDELIAFCRTRLAGFKLPRRVEIVTELPTSAAGKVLKDELRARLTT